MNIDYKDLGGRIKRARRMKKISQEKLAEAIEVTPTHISHIENAKTIPSLKVVINIMNYLGVSPNELFCGTVETAKVTLTKETEMIFEGCSSEQIKRYNKHLKVLKEIDEEKR